MGLQNIANRIVCMLAMALLCVACQNDDFEDTFPVTDGDMVYFGMNLPQIEDIVVTRAEASKLEKDIHSVRLLAFDINGDCFYNNEVFNNKTDIYETSRALGIPKQSGDNYKSCTVYVITNVGTDDGVADGSYDFSEVKTLDDLKATYGYRLLQKNSSGDMQQRTCIPMTGYKEDVDMTQATSIGSPHKIELERVLARVSFTVSVENDNLEFYFNNWTVGSLPRYTYVIPQDVDLTNKPESVDYNPYFPSNETEEELTTYGVSKWLSEIPDNVYGFYMYENRRGNRSDPNPQNLYGEVGDYANEIKNQTDVTGTNPKFKTLYAPDNSSFIILTGLIREKDTQNVTSFAYKIALGGNNYNDYNIQRNHNYVYNIRIKGTTYDDVTVDAFDSRVHPGYALQISAPHCEEIDCHYDKRYLDIIASPGDLELQFYPTEEDARNESNPINDEDWIVLSEIDTYNIDIDQAESTNKTHEFTDVSRKRYFVYTRENLTTSARSVCLRVKHTPTPESSEVVNDPVYRYYTFKQAGVIEVNGMYVESYEEYGWNLDPYSTEQPVQGLQWGWGIVKTGNTVTTAYDFSGTTNTTDGVSNTATIVGTQGEAFPEVDINSLYNNYAARYCYNKNKRNKDGEIIEAKWFLPAIDQLIPMTIQVTGASQNEWTPIKMQDKRYWSSSVPLENKVTGKPDRWVELEDIPIIGAIAKSVWEYFVGNYISEGNDYEFRNVAESAVNGTNEKEEVYFSDRWSIFDYPAEVFSPRYTIKHVRAVRLIE